MLDQVQSRRPALGQALAETATAIDRLFDRTLAVPRDSRGRLVEAMRYAAIGGGKRLRPLLVLASGALFGVPRNHLLRAGMAVECIHVHSLIHDDLPCMDDDALRRGRPTVHIAYDEAVAVLAGDAFLALAFETLASPSTHPDAQVRSHLVLALARRSGAAGMAGGQMLDLAAEAEAELDLDAVTRLQRLKTGALIRWSVGAGAILGDAPADAIASLMAYAQCLGLAFQIADDLIDAAGDESCAGKRLRKDGDRGKKTFVGLLGIDRARDRAERLADQAEDHLRDFGPAADLLRDIARFAVERDR
ncbi:MAG: polyprenyl synthetase family protein [Alphaproteobacteria bacterium]|nr:polyprenyl synthetase family protein [Alphaproteobacteria bacterium]